MRKFVLAAVLVLMASSAQAATLDVVGGQLHGASNVLVDGSLYDVQFLDGTCIALYNGCDDVSDFTFQTNAAAVLASQALLDQVFLDGANLFDTQPYLTVGCPGGGTDLNYCFAATPFGFFTATQFLGVLALNRANDTFDKVLISSHPGLGDLDFRNSINDDLYLYAVWSPVPEPGTALLLGIGLTGLAAKRRRSLRS